MFDDESGYELSDPKHPDWAERAAEHADATRKRARESGPGGVMPPVTLAAVEALAAEVLGPVRPERIAYDRPQTWYFTFGVGMANAGRFYVVENATGDEARQRVCGVFGREWAFQYDAHDWFKHGVSQAEKYGLTELK